MSAAENKAVFLSYASQDVVAALRIAAALRAAGVEVWFDQNELGGGDGWDRKIRVEIKECALFLPVISAATQARTEGYFRREWKLAVERTHDMADHVAFLVPVVIDDTKDREAHVPEKFREVQWTRLPDGQASEKFCARVKMLLGGAADEVGPIASRVTGQRPGLKVSRRAPAAAWIAAVVAVGGAALYFGLRPEKSAGAETPPNLENAAAPMTEARKLTLQARALIDDDWLAGRENFRLAEELCQRAVTLAPDDGEAWATAARVSMETIRRRYNITSAHQAVTRTQVERAIRLAPTSVEAGLAMAAHIASRGNSAEVERRLRELNRRAPQDARVLLMLARVLNYSTVGKDAEATEIRLHHPIFAGRDPRALVDEADALQIRGRFAEADALVDRAHTLAPTLEGYYKKVLLLTQYVRDLGATGAFIESLPTQVLLEDAIASTVARFYIRVGDGAKALTHLRRVPRDFFEEKRQVLPKGFHAGWAQQIAGRSAAAQAEWKHALSVVQKRIVTEPNQPELLHWKAHLLALTGQREEAERFWKLMGELMGRPEGQEGFRYAEFYLALDRPQDAVRALLNMRSFRRSSESYNQASSLLYDPWFEPIRKDPEVQKLITEQEAWLQQGWQSEAKSAGAKSTDTSAPRASPPAEPKSVAVLAFKNLSGDPGREFFSDGLSEAVTDVLGRVPGLKVVGSASAFSFKGKPVPIPEIARQLGVSHLVEGTVLQEGQTLRITAKLIKADGFQVWVSDKLDRDLKNIFALHDEVAGLIAKNLSLKLGASSAASKAAVNPQAFELYVQARQAWNLRTLAGYDLAESLLTRALALEPNFARAHAALADVWMQRRLIPTWRTSEAEDELNSAEQTRIRAKVTQALTLDPDSAEAHASLGSLLFFFDRKYFEAESALRRAVVLNPN